jgi:ABC-type transporter Mla subunit MlaD
MTTTELKGEALKFWAKHDGMIGALLLLAAGFGLGFFSGQSSANLTIAQLQASHSADIQQLQATYTATLERKDQSSRALVTSTAAVVDQVADATKTAAQAADTASDAAAKANEAVDGAKALRKLR